MATDLAHVKLEDGVEHDVVDSVKAGRSKSCWGIAVLVSICIIIAAAGAAYAMLSTPSSQGPSPMPASGHSSYSSGSALKVAKMGGADAKYHNVNGQSLASCSEPGEATTGFMRDGHCTEVHDDAGSHHICIKMEQDFCDVTHQGDWCTTLRDPSTGNGIGHWCVCQWAFAGYLSAKGNDCSAFSEVKCSATNMEARIAYKTKNPTAYACLQSKCGFTD